MREIAEVRGIDAWTLRRWLRDYAPHVLEVLKRRKPSIRDWPPEKILRRLLEVNQKTVAKEIGVSPAAVSKWMQRHAPRGPARALLDIHDTAK